jgi:hypothetical protein
VEFETDDRTVVAGASSLVGLRRGDVLGDRYDVRERLRDDAFTLDYRALDRTTQERVRLREVRPGLLGNRHAVQELLEGLQDVLGLGGAFLPGLRDAGQDGEHVYLVEAWPRGMCLADVFARRIGQGRNLHPKELLPVVARLDAALAVIPDKWHHGDVRARQVWIDAGDLQLTGAFLLDAMPTGAVAMVLQTHPEVRPYFAPEVAEGWAGAPADLYGVAALVWEGLLGEAPPPAGQTSSAVRRLGPLGDVLSQFLAPDPMDRPATLQPLVDALSRAAGRPAPKLDPAPFRPRRSGTTGRRRRDTIPAPPPVDGADEWDALPTQQFDRSMAFPTAGATDPGSRPAPPADLDDAPELSIEEADGDEMELDVMDLEPGSQPQAPQKPSVPIPAGIKGIPRPRRRAPDGPVTRPSGAPEPAVVVRPPSEPPPAAPEPAPETTPDGLEPPTPLPQTTAGRRRAPARAAPTQGRSVWIVLLAFAAAGAILVGSLLFAQHRRLQIEAEKQERIQQRLEQLRSEGQDGAPATAPGP